MKMQADESKNARLLYKAVLTLETEEDCEAFFEDVCTIKEVQSIAQRFAVAKMLIEGNVYNDIAAETGASTATISRVSRALYYGNNAYTKAFGKMAEQDIEDKE